MHKLQPIFLAVEGENSYRVRFQTETGEVEYIFRIDNTPFTLLVSEREFLEITNGDPAADVLKQVICDFHEARHFDYSDEKRGPITRKS